MISKVTVIIELGRVYYQLFYISVGQKSPIGTFVLFPIPSTDLANLTFHTVCLYFFFFFYLTLSSPVISSFHFLSALVVSGPHRKCHGPPCPPVAASHLSFMSLFTHANCAQYLAHGEELRFILRFLLLNKK